MQLSERCFRALMKNSSDVTAVVSRQGEFIFVGEAVAGVFAYRPDDLVGRPVAGFVHPDDRALALERIAARAAAPQGSAGTSTFRLRHADGRWRTVEATGYNQLDDPEIEGIVVNIRDITEQVEAERRLRESEALYHTLAETAPVGIFRADAEGAMVFANRRLAAMTGLEGAGVPGTGWLASVHPDDRVRVEAEWRRCVTGEAPVIVDFRFVGAEGTSTAVLLQSAPHHDAAGRPQGCVGTITDMSEYVRTAEALLMAEARTNAIVDAAADAILTIDEEGIIHSYNRAAERMFGIPAADMLWQKVNRLMPPPHDTAHDGYLRGYRTGGAVPAGPRRDIWARRGDGTLFPIELSVSAVETNGRRLFTGIIRDVTERKRVEGELIQAKELAEAADRAKSAFLATMSHELRTPLNAVIGFAQVIEMRLLGVDAIDRYTEYAGSIRRSGEHLLAIIDDILDISKIEAGALQLAEQPVDMTDLAGQALNLVAMQAGQRGVGLAIELDRDLPPVRADELRLRQILLNLLSNGVKFTDTGGTVTLVGRRAADGGMELGVRDTGVGMAPEDIPVALAPFSQVDQSMTRRYEGTGLGLPLTKRLVDLHGGRLSIDSTPGRGTTVTVHLPAERVMSVEEMVGMA
ncbi:MAG TPA: PAS domain S-box protein [Azospirillum sp.]